MPALRTFRFFSPKVPDKHINYREYHAYNAISNNSGSIDHLSFLLLNFLWPIVCLSCLWSFARVTANVCQLWEGWALLIPLHKPCTKAE